MAVPARDLPLKGYKKKPISISLIAIGFLLIPVVIGVQLVGLSGGSWQLVGPLLSSRYFLQEWILSWSAAAAVFIVSRWSLAYFVGLSVTVLTNRFMGLAAHSAPDTPLSLGVTGFWFAVVIYFLASELKTPYLNPKLRWWKRPIRREISGEATLLYQGVKVPVEVLNISEGGVFVRLDELAAKDRPFPKRLGERFQFEMAPAFRSAAQLVWKAAPQSPYRYGMGIQFIALSREQKRLLKKYLRHEA